MKNSMFHPFKHLAVVCTMALAAVTAMPQPTAYAHPHVWVTVKAEIVYSDHHIKGFQQYWTFDDMYTAMAIQGLDTNKDGTFDRSELQELAKINVESLKEFAYFTYPKLGDTELELSQPQDYWLEHNNGVLTLHFFMPLKTPVLASAQGFKFQVYDPSYYIAFDLAKDNPVQLTGNAPKNCNLNIGVPKPDQAEATQLSEAFFTQLGGDYGISLSKTISVSCPQS